MAGTWKELLVPDTLIDHRAKVIGAINDSATSTSKILATYMDDIPQSQVTGLDAALLGSLKLMI